MKFKKQDLTSIHSQNLDRKERDASKQPVTNVGKKDTRRRPLAVLRELTMKGEANDQINHLCIGSFVSDNRRRLCGGHKTISRC